MQRLSELERFATRRRAELPSLATFDVAVLSEPALLAARFVWQRRLDNETASVIVAQRLITAGRAVGVDAPALARLEADERDHVALCASMLAALGVDAPVAKDVLDALPVESAAESFLRQVVDALCICETVSAARYTRVLSATDLDGPHAVIARLRSDEVQHGHLGFALLPLAGAAFGREWPRFASRVAEGAIADLSRRIGMGGPNLPAPAAQPSTNPGVVEPLVDAHAFFDAVTNVVVPSFAAQNVDVRLPWALAT